LLQWNAEHIPLSASMASNVQGFAEPVCFINDMEWMKCFKKCWNIWKKFLELHIKYFQKNFNTSFFFWNRGRKTSIFLHSLQSYLKELPVVGFNSGKYDLCVIKEQFFKLYYSKIEFVVKKYNNYVCIKSPTLKFLDMINYIAPGFSYQNFIKTFVVEDNKFFLP